MGSDRFRLPRRMASWIRRCAAPANERSPSNRRERLSIPSPTSLCAHHCVPSTVHVRLVSEGPHSPTSSGSAFPINKWP